ncbi:MAG: hypothetical protein ACKVGT_03885 [Flavobacteriales bacterium]|tara:strand:+ start:552 stop:983 length:432 start_codon:yes stop_codon:yes gene_type:complete
MKKTHIILTIFLTALLVTSCETYDDYAERPVVAGFNLGNVLELPLSNNLPVINFNIPYFISEASPSDRTFQIIVVADQTSAPSSSYSFDSTIMIPANERSGSLAFTALNIDLTTEFQPLVLAFESTDGIVGGDVARIALKTNN